jgi:hypothetical protein
MQHASAELAPGEQEVRLGSGQPSATAAAEARAGRWRRYRERASMVRARAVDRPRREGREYK